MSIVFSFDYVSMSDPNKAISLFNEIINEFIEFGYQTLCVQVILKEKRSQTIDTYINNMVALNNEFRVFVEKLQMFNGGIFSYTLKSPRNIQDILNETIKIVDDCGKSPNIIVEKIRSKTVRNLSIKMGTLKHICNDPNFEQFDKFTYTNYINLIQYVNNNILVSPSR